jgi:hypothetical protein
MKQKLNRDVVEYAFSDIFLSRIPRDRKFQLKQRLKQQKNEELGRKLKRCMNSLFTLSCYKDKHGLDKSDRQALDEYLKRRLSYDNAVITMIVLLAAEEPNAILHGLADLTGPFTVDHIANVLERPTITDINKRLHDCVKNTYQNILIELPSGKYIQIQKLKHDNTTKKYWGSAIFDQLRWALTAVHKIILVYPLNFNIKKFFLSNSIFINVAANYDPAIYYIENTGSTLDVYLIHDSHISHSRYLVDRHGVAKVFELRPHQSGKLS